jgi:hypothetical protein
MTDGQSQGGTVHPEFEKEEAEALLSYAESSLQSDDSFDEFRKNVVAACDELERSLATGTDRSDGGDER